MGEHFSEPHFITIGSIAKYCMVSPTTVRRWIEGGKLKAAKLPGGRYRVTVETLIDFLKRYNMPISDDLVREQKQKE